MPYVVLDVELLLAQLAAVGALEARRLPAVVFEVGRDGALRRVRLPTPGAGEPRLALPRAILRLIILEPGQRQHL